MAKCNFRGRENNSDLELTCDLLDLKLVENVTEEHAAGWYEIVNIFRCPKCNQLWEIKEVFDSHLGTRRHCKKTPQ